MAKSPLKKGRRSSNGHTRSSDSDQELMTYLTHELHLPKTTARSFVRNSKEAERETAAEMRGLGRAIRMTYA